MELIHGGGIFAAAERHGVSWKQVLDFSASINPLEFLGDALRPLCWQLYRPLRGIVYSTATLFVLVVGGIAAWS